MMPGGAPIDWTQPLAPHKMKNTAIITIPGMDTALPRKPRRPITRLTTAETKRPAAMNRLILQ